ncbi:hypothetical protein AX16_005043 [Volvariella volvacea WC 439]|nr:hypothetical protein AX16_005043 [Volvariella volvacea WC 439]
MNPFAGWNQGSAGSQAPSIFGALPYPTAPSAPNLLTFQFLSFRPDITNCTVVGPQNQVYYQIVTEPHNPGYTVVKDSKGKNLSLVEWQSHPLVEIRGVMQKEPVKNWLKLSNTKTSRSMDIRGMQLVWAPQERSINLYFSTSAGVKCMAKVTRAPTAVTIEVTTEAYQMNLMDSIITATLLLQCGRNID